MTETVEFFGEDFHIAERIGAMPFMRFAKVAKAGTDANDLDGLAAIFDLLAECIHPDDWPLFQKHADKEKATGDQLLGFVRAVLGVVAARPTGRSSDSSDGPRIIEPSSTDDSSSPATDRVVQRLNDRGRPDLALIVRKRQESLSA